MKKIGKAIKAVGQIVRKPHLLNLVVDENENWRKVVIKKHGFESFPVIDLDVLFGSFHNIKIDIMAYLDGSSMPTDIAVLKTLANRFDDCRYFEIGTWRGESVINVALVAKECYTLNLSEEEMRAKGWDEKYIQLHGYFSKNNPGIQHLEGDSLSYDFSTLGKFDLIFIDGDHHYESIKSDTSNVFKHLVHDKSIVLWHDYTRNPETIRHESMCAILDGIPEDKKDNLVYINNTLMAAYFPEKLNTVPFESPATPRSVFETRITLK